MSPNKAPHVKPCDKAEWLILDSVENANLRRHMLGAVVPKAAQYRPFDDYSPHWNDPDLESVLTEKKEPSHGKLPQPLTGNGETTKGAVLQAMLEKLWRPTRDFRANSLTVEEEPPPEDESVQLNDIIAGKIAAKTTGMKAAVTDFFNILTRKHETEQVNIESGTVRRYKIDNAGAKVEDLLMPCIPWKEQLQKLFNRTNDKLSPFFLVTGIMVCDDIKVRWSLDQKRNVELGSKIDGNALLALLHQPPNSELAKYLDTKFEFDRERSSTENIFATCKHPVILAIRYNRLYLEYENLDQPQPNIFLRPFVRARVPGAIKGAKLGEVIRGRGMNGYASSNVSIENDEGEDWFYSRPATDAESTFEDVADGGNPANGNAGN